jgi:glycerol-3-phosphate dehydrogenase (NAD(P)+)
MSHRSQVIGVLGAGAWGTALAIHLAKLHDSVTLWARDSQHLHDCINTRENQRYLEGIALPENINAQANLNTLIQTADILIVATPSAAIRNMMQAITKHHSQHFQGVIWACKGLEQGTGKFLHEVAAEECPRDIKHAILSGPSFAREVGAGLPTAVTMASNDNNFAQQAAQLFHHSMFRCYTSSDLIAVEIGGAFKNILAIAAGIIDGLEFGANARAALITRGIAEMTRLGRQLHANTETFSGLSGIGDIVLTCTENLSRNRRFGLGLGQGHSVEQVEDQIGQVIEGKFAALEIYQLSQKHAIELPICEQVHAVLYAHKDPRLAVEELLARSLKQESE